MSEKCAVKVLHIAEDLSIGGLERIVQSLATGLSGGKYDVDVWCLTKGGAIADELRAAGFEVEVLGMGPRCTLPFLLGLIKKIKKNNIYILHAHGYTAATIGRVAGFLAGVPVLISHVHSHDQQYTAKQLLIEKLLSLITDKVICCSSAAAEFVVRSEKISRTKVVVVYNGVPDLRRSEAAVRRPAAGFVVGLAASFVENKGHIYFIQAMKKIIGAYPETRAILAGEGPLKKDMENLAERLGIGANLTFCGIVRDMGSFFSAIDLAVLPSWKREGLSNVILEAMSAGKAVVGSSIGGIPEAVVDGETGLIVAPGDSSALAGAILCLMRDSAILERMGRAGRARYETTFTREKMLSRISGIYDELLAR